MSKPLFLVTLGAVAGAVVGVIHGGGGLGREVGDMILAAVAPIYRTVEPAGRSPRTPTPGAENDVAGAGAAHSVFTMCLQQTGGNAEKTLRDLLEFHEHDATVALVGCLLNSSPQRFCTPAGRQQAADAMEIYLWSRDDAHRTSPAHGLADKIHLLDRAAETGEPPDGADPFALTWSGPNDRAIFDRLKTLVKQGYIEAGAFSFSGRAELREALRDVKTEGAPCAALARND
jgi:hypothetical protein